MPMRRIVVSAVFAVGIAALPLSNAEAQYYYYPCNPFPLTWPLCVAGAVVGTAATIATAPFQPYYYYGQPYYYGQTYYAPTYYPRPYRYVRRHIRRRIVHNAPPTATTPQVAVPPTQTEQPPQTAAPQGQPTKP